jgi:hypothetical protein
MRYTESDAAIAPDEISTTSSKRVSAPRFWQIIQSSKQMGALDEKNLILCIIALK